MALEEEGLEGGSACPQAQPKIIEDIHKVDEPQGIVLVLDGLETLEVDGPDPIQQKPIPDGGEGPQLA